MTNQPHFDGDTYEADRDHKRLTGQLWDIYKFMSDLEWHTFDEISEATGVPQTSVSARLRDLRKEKFGSHIVERRHVGDGLHKYRLARGPGIVNGALIKTPLGTALQDAPPPKPEISEELQRFYRVEQKWGHGHHVTRDDRQKMCRDPEQCYQCRKVRDHIAHLKKKDRVMA